MYADDFANNLKYIFLLFNECIFISAHDTFTTEARPSK